MLFKVFIEISLKWLTLGWVQRIKKLGTTVLHTFAVHGRLLRHFGSANKTQRKYVKNGGLLGCFLDPEVGGFLK